MEDMLFPSSAKLSQARAVAKDGAPGSPSRWAEKDGS